MIEAPVTKCDSGTQTDTHFMETNIVKSYEWNEWELRRKALKLVGLKLYISRYKICVIDNKGLIGLCWRGGGLVVSALDSGSRGPGSSPGRVIVLCSWTRHLTLTGPLYTRE